jgi:hypothetical protein
MAKTKTKSKKKQANSKGEVLAVIRREVEQVKERLDSIASFGTESIVVGSLGSEVVSVIKPLQVTIRRDGDEFIASALDANISSGGATLADAVANLQSLLSDIAPDLLQRPDDVLGRSMLKQKRVLAEHLRLRS